MWSCIFKQHLATNFWSGQDIGLVMNLPILRVQYGVIIYSNDVTDKFKYKWYDECYILGDVLVWCFTQKV